MCFRIEGSCAVGLTIHTVALVVRVQFDIQLIHLKTVIITAYFFNYYFASSFISCVPRLLTKIYFPQNLLDRLAYNLVWYVID